MRIIFPTNDNNGYLSKMGAHFGKANYYTIITIKDNEIADVESVVNHGHGNGACGNAVANILALNPDALVVVGIGQSPAEGFAKANLPVYMDKESLTVEESVEKLIHNQLTPINGIGTCSIK